jgi:hypothetical protein
MATFEALIQDLDTKVYAAVYNAAKQATQSVVADLQQAGPSWSGKFSNSWEIKEGNVSVSGNGVPGEPVAVIFPGLSRSTRKAQRTDVIVFKITNTSPYKDLAMDKVEGSFTRPTKLPQTSLGRSKFDEILQGRTSSSQRGNIGGGSAGVSSRTANLDWYSDYVSSGRIERIIKTQLSSLVRRTA